MCAASSEVFALWQWYNFAVQRVPAGKRALRINMDESAIRLLQGGRKGNVFPSKTKPPAQHASLNQRRPYLTHGAVRRNRNRAGRGCRSKNRPA